MSTFTELLLLLVVRLYARVSVSTRNLVVFYKASMCPYRLSLSDVGDVHKLSLYSSSSAFDVVLSYLESRKGDELHRQA